MGKIYTIVNQKGGVGKTTTAVNLSSALHDMGLKTLLCDFDPQANATSGLGIEKRKIKRSIYDVIVNGVSAADAVLSTPYGDVLPSSADLAGAAVELINIDNREKQLKEALQPLKENYDVILIDCPPSLELLTLNGLCAADGIIVPVQCEYYALEGVGQLVNTIKLMKKKLNPQLAIEGILLTMYDARTNLCAQVVQEVRNHFADEAFETMIPRNVRLSEAPSYGVPIHLYDARCSGTQAYRELAKELNKRNGG